MKGERARPVWRDPTLIGATVVLLMAVAAVALIGYDQLNQPVLTAPVDAAGVPTQQPDGAGLPRVPEALAGAFERPVVLVGSVEQPLDGLERCGQLAEWEFAPTVRASVVTPEGLTVSIRGEERGTELLLHVTCFAEWGGRSWRTWASWVAQADDPSQPLGSPEPICCRDDGLVLQAQETLAPEGAAWLVQDRGPYWLAYPVISDQLVHPVWPAGDGDPDPPPTVFLDASGRLLEDADGPPEDVDGPPEDVDGPPEDADTEAPVGDEVG